MPIEEKAINSALAAVIMKQGIHATPEATNPATGTKRCDVQIKQKDNDLYFTAVECKIGQGTTQRRAAAEDAKRWYELLPSACWNAISVCYPERISTDTKTSLDNKLLNASDLLMARIDSSGVIRNWRKGGIAEIIELASDVEASETHAITTVLKKAIKDASINVTISTGKELAEALRLPWQPKNKGGGMTQDRL